jgi:hypothetical protein
MHFWKAIRSLRPKYHICFLCSAFAMRILYFRVKKLQKASSTAIFFLFKIGQYGCKKIQNFLLISDLEKLFRKMHRKKLDPKKHFFLETGFFSKIVLRDYLFFGTVLQKIPSDLKSAKNS